MGLLHFIVKYTLFFLNLLDAICGIAFIVLGVLLHFKLIDSQPDPAVNDEELDARIKSLTTVFTIVLGCVLFIISFTGCCGAVTETKCLLVTHAVIMFVLITAKICLLVWIRDINSVRDNAKEYINSTFNEPAHNATMRFIEAAFECCGTTGPDSYKVLPPTCCELKSNRTTINVKSPCLLENAFSIGCLESVDGFVVDNWLGLRIYFIVTIVSEILQFAAAVYLCIFTSSDE